MEETKETKQIEKSKFKFNYWIIISVVLAIALVFTVVNGKYIGISGLATGSSTDDISAKAVEFFKTVQGIDITITSVTPVAGMYQLAVSANGNDGIIFMSKDGAYIGSMNSISDIMESATNSADQTPAEMQKSDKPKIDLFVMSFCPYGNKAEDTMMPVYNLLKNKAEWNIHYIVSITGDVVSSLHGQPEVDQNEREACVLDKYGLDEWWSFTTYVNKNCGSDGACWKDAAKASNLNADTIETCVASKGLELMKNSELASNVAGAQGSPTLFINDVASSAVYKYGNAEIYKQAICAAFTTAPAECSEALQAVADSSGASGSCA